MEIVAPLARSPDFQFKNTTFSPYTIAPSSPTPFGDPFNYQYQYTSAPASPARAAAIYSQFTDWAYPSPNSRRRNDNGGDVLEFAFSPSWYPVGHRSPEITTADKLFEKGRIWPLQERGRNSLAANSSRKVPRKSRSLSPSRDEVFLAMNSPSANPVKYGLSRKWPRLKDLLLFRSASEGQVTRRGNKDSLQKFTILPSVSSVDKKRQGEDKKTRGGGGETVKRGSRPAVSPHEKHYTANRAAAEEQKRKTPLPFQRYGLLGFIDFSPAIRGKNKMVGVSSFPERNF